MLLSAEHLSINFGSRQLLEDVNFYLNEGDKVGVIGINGTGKSTFLKVLAGKLEADAGTISRNPNVQVSLLEQNPPWRMTPPFWNRYSCISPRNSGS
ncbi:MAG: ATP-binding cassette domain-containing protein [Dysosmobacter sp.]